MNVKYLITEKQLENLLEITKSSGHYNTEPIYDFFDWVDDLLTTKVKLESFKKYFEEKLNMKVNDEESSFKYLVKDYFYDPRLSDLPKKFREKDAMSGYAYYLAKKYLKLNEKYGLQYMKYKEDDGDTTFFFFDPGFKIFVGKITISPESDLPKKTYSVAVSATDSELKGKGYGTKMYLIVIENVDYLASDTVLFTGAYRMWKHILPKYVNVWGVIENEYGRKGFEKIELNPKLQVKKYKFFLASTKDSL